MSVRMSVETIQLRMNVGRTVTSAESLGGVIDDANAPPVEVKLEFEEYTATALQPPTDAGVAAFVVMAT